MLYIKTGHGLDNHVLDRITPVKKECKPLISIGFIQLLSKCVYHYNKLWVKASVAKGYIWAHKASLVDIRSYLDGTTKKDLQGKQADFKRGVLWFIKEYNEKAQEIGSLPLSTMLELAKKA